ncbi:hypothetical protein ACIQPQ_31095 [Streptomyces sp. NPDC091281]|uniref:hypothetical protein n=1 Tax=Streptomyces sp. NPDC091281 TaxID=3365985 RepID=UPI0037F78AF6
MIWRKVAGVAVLSLIPLTFITLAVLAGQLVELAIGAAISFFLMLCAWGGVRLLIGKIGRGESP